MEIRSLGKSGLKVTSLAIGTASFGEAASEPAAHEMLDLAYEAGVRLIDTADGYPSEPGLQGLSEKIIGRWLKSRGVRDDMVVATKVNFPMSDSPNGRGLSRKHIRSAVEGSLRRLQIDTVDLLQAHQVDPTTPIEETLGAFGGAIRDGKIQYYGVSNWPAWLIAKACYIADEMGIERPISSQVPYSLVYREVEAEGVPLCADAGLGVLAINCLAGGLLSGRYRFDEDPPPGRFSNSLVGSTGRRLGDLYKRRYWSQEHFAAVEELRDLCGGEPSKMVATAIAWVESRRCVGSVLLGASKVDQLRDQLAASSLALDPTLCSSLDELWWGIPRNRSW